MTLKKTNKKSLNNTDIVSIPNSQSTSLGRERKFCSLIDQTGVGFELLDSQGRYIDVNSVLCKMLEYSCNELLEMKISQIDLSETDTAFLAGFKTFICNTVRTFETTYCKKNGIEFPVNISATLVRLDESDFVIRIVQDITEQKHQLTELINCRKLFNTILNIIPQGVFWKDTDLVYQGCNKQFSLIAGIKVPEDIIGKTDFDLPWLQQEAEVYRSDDRQVLSSGKSKPHIIESALISDGSRIWVDTTKVPVIDDQGQVFAVLGIFDDITKLKRSELALVHSERRSRTILENILDALIVYDLDGFILEVNNNTGHMFDLTIDQMEGKTLVEVFPPDLVDLVQEMFARLNTDGEFIFEKKVTFRNNRILWIEIRAKLISREDNGLIYGLFRDITMSKLAEAALRTSEKKYRSLFESMNEGFCLHEVITNHEGEPIDYIILDANPAYEKILDINIENAINRRATEVYNVPTPPFLEIYSKVAFSGEPISFETDFEPMNKSFRITVFCPERGWFATIFEDSTQRKRTEETLNNAQKLESLGLLAGGIAHDFNNLLSGIFGYIDLANDKTNEKQGINYLEKALDTIGRARALTQQLLTFAKGGMPIRKIDKLVPLIQDATKFALSGSKISCNFSIAEDLWLCEFDKNQIGQVIDNIVINAQQAMSEGGIIQISAQNIELFNNVQQSLSAGKYVKISFKDSGAGIPKELFSKIFDPFFTTKAKGHGLGLATSYSIIKRHGGSIDVESTPGKGSTFHIYLPASFKKIDNDIIESSTEYRGSGTILILDDEEIILETVGHMLKSLGYSVIGTKNYTEVISFIKEAKDNSLAIKAAILDLTIPGQKGSKEMINEIRTINPELPVFVASGYADDHIIAYPKDYGFTDSICKPFRRSDLIEMLKKHLIN